MLLHHLIKGCTVMWLRLNVLSCCKTPQALGDVEFLLWLEFGNPGLIYITEKYFWKRFMPVPNRIQLMELFTFFTHYLYFLSNRESRAKTWSQNTDTMCYKVPHRVDRRDVNSVNGLVTTVEMAGRSFS